MVEAVADRSARSRRGNLRLLGMVVGGLVLVGGGFAGGYVFSKQQVSPGKEVERLLGQTAPTQDAGDPEPERVPRDLPTQDAFLTQYYEFPEPLTTNLRGSRRFLQIGIGVSTQYDKLVLDNVQTHTVALRSDMLAIISGFSETDIEGKEGRDRLAAAIRDAINARLERLEGFGGVEDVFFSTFVMQ
ncbi:flagellar basal body-associated FliL family protein [Meridianimarinicoccus sp. RP-17]|uniref:flagellar basal body-associated FliL family protein n=1 Tax=Meridianimarinicoccus zhengii TaxID=2056810 RepID=UPI000DADD76F|nr:flagellar basal body-associated FliL family protein [Phycocomes zhengii]